MTTTRYCNDGKTGVNLNRNDLSTTYPIGPAFPLGTRCVDNLGGTWIYCQAAAAITGQGYACQIVIATFLATMITTANSLRGNLIGYPANAVAINEYAWFQIGGPCEAVRVLASAVTRVRLNTTATPGALDDDGTAATKEALGITINTTASAAEQNIAGELVTDASVGVTL